VIRSKRSLDVGTRVPHVGVGARADCERSCRVSWSAIDVQTQRERATGVTPRSVARGKLPAA
jgi:hypothetical protein